MLRDYTCQKVYSYNTNVNALNHRGSGTVYKNKHSRRRSTCRLKAQTISLQGLDIEQIRMQVTVYIFKVFTFTYI